MTNLFFNFGKHVVMIESLLLLLLLLPQRVEPSATAVRSSVDGTTLCYQGTATEVTEACLNHHDAASNSTCCTNGACSWPDSLSGVVSVCLNNCQNQFGCFFDHYETDRIEVYSDVVAYTSSHYNAEGTTYYSGSSTDVTTLCNSLDDSHKCCTDGACDWPDSMVGRVFVTPNSCQGDQACHFSDHQQNIYVESGSCLGRKACYEFGTSTRVGGSLTRVGTNSCQGESACAFVQASVGNDSCNADAACEGASSKVGDCCTTPTTCFDGECIPTFSPTQSPTTPSPTQSPTATTRTRPATPRGVACEDVCNVCTEDQQEVVSGTVCCYGDKICKKASIDLGSNKLCCKGKQACKQATFTSSSRETNTIQCSGDQACKLADLGGVGAETHCCSGDDDDDDDSCKHTTWP